MSNYHEPISVLEVPHATFSIDRNNRVTATSPDKGSIGSQTVEALLLFSILQELKRAAPPITPASPVAWRNHYSDGSPSTMFTSEGAALDDAASFDTRTLVRVTTSPLYLAPPATPAASREVELQRQLDIANTLLGERMKADATPAATVSDGWCYVASGSLYEVMDAVRRHATKMTNEEILHNLDFHPAAAPRKPDEGSGK